MYFKSPFQTFVLVAIALSLFAGCGKEQTTDTSVPPGWSGLAEQKGLAPVMTQTAAHAEIEQVMAEINQQLAGGVFQSMSSSSTMSKSARARSLSSILTGASCAPAVSLVGLGVSLQFTASSTCFLSGTMTINFYPLSANLDLTVVGLTFVKGISIKGNIDLSTTNGISTVTLLVQDGHMTLNPGGSVPTATFVVCGKTILSFGGGSAEFATRTNVFESTTGVGGALSADIKLGASTSKAASFCMLTGGDAMNPDAGTLAGCYSVLK